MQIAVVDSCLNLTHDIKLQGFHTINEIDEALVIVRVSACDIRCIAVHGSACVNQKRTKLIRWLLIKIRVMQY